mgnify:CR=1 FL=1
MRKRAWERSLWGYRGEADVEDENGDLRDQYVSYLQELAEAQGYIRRGR